MSIRDMPHDSLLARKSRGEIARLVIERIDPSLPMPTYAHGGDAGFDLYAALKSVKCVDLQSHDTMKIPTGIRMVIPEGYEVQIRPRSSKASEGLVAQFGTVDCGYRGQLFINLTNNTESVKVVWYGDRIAQAVLTPVTRANIVEGNVENDTERGEGGFGSTGR